MSDVVDAPDPPAVLEGPDLPCPHCGYNLHGIASARCPECGGAVDRAMLAGSRIAWEHRNEIGRVRAYWRTAKAFTFSARNPVFAGAMPVYADALRFRRVTVAVASLPVIVMGFVVLWSCEVTYASLDVGWLVDSYYYLRDAEAIWMRFSLAPASLAVTLVSLPLVLLATTGVVPILFRWTSMPVERQARSAALAQYACAPLAWAPLTWGGLMVAYLCLTRFGIDSRTGDWVGLALVVGWSLGLVQIMVWWWWTWRLMGAATHATLARQLAAAALLPIVWAAVAALILLALHGVFSFLVLVVVSVLRG